MCRSLFEDSCLLEYNAMMRALLFWDVMQHWLAVSFQHFSWTCWLHLQAWNSPILTLKMGWIGRPKTRVTNCQSVPHNIPEECWSCLHSQKPEIMHNAMLLGVTLQKKLVFSNMTENPNFASHYFLYAIGFIVIYFLWCNFRTQQCILKISCVWREMLSHE
jgi:hypothetical protein